MKNKKFDTVKTFGSIRDENYEAAKDMTRKELLERYKKRGKEAIKKISQPSQSSELTGQIH